jgi:hypothetical protein
MREMARADVSEVAAADTASGHADNAERQAEAPAARHFRPAAMPTVLQHWRV